MRFHIWDTSFSVSQIQSCMYLNNYIEKVNNDTEIRICIARKSNISLPQISKTRQNTILRVKIPTPSAFYVHKCFFVRFFLTSRSKCAYNVKTSWLSVKAAKYRTVLGVWAERDLYRASPEVKRGLGFHGLIWKTIPNIVAFSTSRGLRRTYSDSFPMGWYKHQQS